MTFDSLVVVCVSKIETATTPAPSVVKKMNNKTYLWSHPIWGANKSIATAYRSIQLGADAKINQFDLSIVCH